MDQATCKRIAAELGLTADCAQELLKLPFERAVSELQAVKNAARSKYKKLVFQWHPDRNPDDPTAAQKIADLNDTLKLIEALQIQRAAPLPPILHVQFVHTEPVHVQHVRTSYSTTSTTTSYRAAYCARRVVHIRPM
jgi:hypothetical protein